jgi:transcriptional regulator with XRE-family HTH domain
VTAARMRQAMAAAELDQRELAERVGVTPGAINQIVTGRTTKSKYLPDIARELRVSLAYLMGATDDPGKQTPDMQELTSQEQRLLDIWRDLPKKDQAALKTLLERMAADTDSGQ